MSLDVALLSGDDSLVRCVPLSLELHHRLMTIAEEKQLELLIRLKDYYSDAEIFHQELTDLIDELRVIAGSARDHQVLDVIAELQSIAELARERKRSLVAIAD